MDKKAWGEPSSAITPYVVLCRSLPHLSLSFPPGVRGRRTRDLRSTSASGSWAQPRGGGGGTVLGLPCPPWAFQGCLSPSLPAHPVLDLQVREPHPLALAQGHHGAFNGLCGRRSSGLGLCSPPATWAGGPGGLSSLRDTGGGRGLRRWPASRGSWEMERPPPEDSTQIRPKSPRTTPAGPTYVPGSPRRVPAQDHVGDGSLLPVLPGEDGLHVSPKVCVWAQEGIKEQGHRALAPAFKAFRQVL